MLQKDATRWQTWRLHKDLIFYPIPLAVFGVGKEGAVMPSWLCPTSMRFQVLPLWAVYPFPFLPRNPFEPVILDSRFLQSLGSYSFPQVAYSPPSRGT